MAEQEKYVVSSTSADGIIGYICFVIFGLFTIGFTALVVLDQFTAEEKNFIIFGYAFLFFALALSAFAIYRERRPRIVVKNETLICYPRWKSKTIIQILDITARTTKLKTNNSSFAFGGAVGYAVTKGKYGGTLLDITYYIGTRPIINIDTDMKNARKLDSVIMKSIEKKEAPQEK